MACLASSVNSNAVTIEAIIGINSPSYTVEGWRTFLIFAALMVFCVIMNVWLFRLVPWLEVLAGVLNVVLFIVIMVTLWVMAPRNPAGFLLEKSVSSGWDNYFVSWNIGILSQVWCFVGKLALRSSKL